MRYIVDIRVSSVVEVASEAEAKSIGEATLQEISTVCDLPYPDFDLEVEEYD